MFKVHTNDIIFLQNSFEFFKNNQVGWIGTGLH